METSASQRFPRGLLKQPLSERLQYFESYKAAHPRLVQATKTLLQNIENPAGASFIFVYGPTGIGKTTMRLRTEQKLIQQVLPLLEADKDRIPVVGIEAVGTESSSFNWKDYFTRGLIALEEPLIADKIDYGSQGVYRNEQGQLVIQPKVAAPELRRALEKALKYRQPQAFFVDEAQHMQKMASGRRLQDNLDCLKSIVNLTGVVHILIGTYELLIFRNLSAQLSRRSVDIHFSRYRADVSEDLKAFMGILLTFQRHLPLPQEPDLLCHWQYCYQRSLGCIGVLKNWLTRALIDALKENASTLTLQHLENHALSVAQCQKMFAEIQEGERQLVETSDASEKLSLALGLSAGLVQASPAPFEIDSHSQSVPEKLSCKKRNVGKRKVTRDPAGGIYESAG
ncbi:ATP-binding protein [Nostoc sp. XA013]|nr:ATP-binding protein [Nostoc sp. XA013]